MKDANFNAALDLLDVELVDVNGRQCGRIDELELAGRPGEPLEVAALLVGRGAWRARLPRALQWLARGVPVRIPWSEILEIDSQIRLSDTEREYHLNDGEWKPGRLISKVPRS
jgi:sporulation protein YlmC with PRC-barrel domain